MNDINLAAYACESCLINRTYQLRHHRSGPCPLCGKELVVAGKEDQVRVKYQPTTAWMNNEMEKEI